MDTVVRAFPLLPGKREALEDFKREIQSRAKERDEFYRGYGVRHETWHLQASRQGDLVIVCTEVEDSKRVAQEYAASNAAFDAWFKLRVRQLSGVDPNLHPLGPECTCVFDWQDRT